MNSARVPLKLLGRVARQLHAINRKHLPPDQALAVAHREHRRKQLRDVVTARADEMGNGGEVRRGHAAERHDRHVLLADAFDRPAPHDALRVREEHDLEQHGRWVRRRAGRVIAEASVEVRQIDFVIEQMIERVLERARE